MWRGAALAWAVAWAAPAASSSAVPAAFARKPASAMPAGSARVDSLRAPEPELLLTWTAPFGAPRATDRLAFSCADNAGADTLYLCLEPGKDSPHFNGFVATLDFHAAFGDSLAPYWKLGDGPWGKFDHASVQFKVDSGLAAPQPWNVPGFGFARYTRTHGSGSLEMIFAVDTIASAPVRAGTVYCLARVIIGRDRADRAGCDQALCVEWTRAEIAFWIGDSPEVKHGDRRFVSVNSPGGVVCREFRGPARPEPWRPGRR